MRQLAIVTDLDRCTGCQACSVACAQENHLRPGVLWTRVQQIGPAGKFPELRMYFLPIACQHCANPACVQACPTGASYKRDDGIVLIDAEKCIGCESCRKACPYGVQYFDADAKKTQKCTLCAHLVDQGEKPSCVRTCTTHARVFGDINDPSSEAAQMLRTAGDATHVLIPEAGTEPSGRFILRRQQWEGGAAQQL